MAAPPQLPSLPRPRSNLGRQEKQAEASAFSRKKKRDRHQLHTVVHYDMVGDDPASLFEKRLTPLLLNVEI
jgi:hypothetical protein